MGYQQRSQVCIRVNRTLRSSSANSVIFSFLVRVYTRPICTYSFNPFYCSGHGRVVLYLYPPSRPHRACNGITSPLKGKGKAVPLQAWTGPEGSRKLRFPDFVTTAQDGGRLSALRTGRLHPQEILPVLISVRG